MAAAAVTYYANVGGSIAPFVISGVALALLASLVGRSVEALGDRLGAGATGVVQSALGNLPELFVVLFALKSKLYEVATATIVGSVLANVLLVLGLAFIAGGARNGVQRFEPRGARRVSLMLGTSHDEGSEEGPGWPLWLALTMLAVTGSLPRSFPTGSWPA
jgi:Ca2+:H+ antiporter